MNKVILCGRLTAEPEVRYSQSNGNSMAVARYTIAIDRPGVNAGADFIRCIAFGKSGEFVDRFLHKGMKMIVEGRIQTGSYKDKEGRTVYTTDVIVDRHEFAESQRTHDNDFTAPAAENRQSSVGDGFMDIPDDAVEDAGLPFN